MHRITLSHFLLLLSCFAIVIVIQTGQVRQTSGDSQLTLLTSQAIIENGNVSLSKYYDQIPEDQFTSGKWKFRYNNQKNQLEYIYPIGNSIISIPFVFIAKKLGMSMLIREHDSGLQLFLASIFAVILFLLNYRLAKLFLDDGAALFICLVYSFCSSYISTCGTALWSFNFELICIVFVLLEIIKTENNKDYCSNSLLLGLILFTAWLCRPSAMVFILVFFIWQFVRKRNLFLKTILSFSLTLYAFVLLSYHWYGSAIPSYYNPFLWQSFAKTVSIYEGFLLVLLSPNRGLFVYSPFLIFSFVALFSKERKTFLVKLLLAWFFVYCISLGNLSNWWGGWSFGARLATDILPCLFLLTLIGFKHLNLTPIKQQFLMYSFATTAFLGFLINTVQGVYNIETYNWNDYPAIDKYHKFYQWNWDYPQFLATKNNNEIKKTDFEWNLMYSKFILRTPENANILMGIPDSKLLKITERWNNEKLYGNRYFFNSLNEKINSDTFYFFRPSHDYMRSYPRTDIIFKSEIEFAEFLEENQDFLIILAARGNWKGNLSEKLKSTFNHFNLKLGDINNFSSYLAVIDQGEKSKELYADNNEVKHSFEAGIAKIEVLSSSDIASFKMNGKELSINIEGINILVLDKNMEIDKMGYIDLKQNENFIDLYLYKGVKNFLSAK